MAKAKSPLVEMSVVSEMIPDDEAIVANRFFGSSGS